MTERVPIHIYCIAFGTRKVASSRGPVGQEVLFYSDGRIDERFANLKDIMTQAQQISSLSADKSAYKDMEDMASYTGAAYKTSMGTLYYYIRRAMHTNVERASSYGQIVIYKKEDLAEQDSFMKNVLGFHFLTEDQITGMEHHPLSRKEVELADKVLPVDLRTLPEARRNSLCHAAELLLKGQKVMLRLSEGARFVSQCQQILVELFTLLPDAARSDISFSTCRKSNDFYRTGNIQLLIVDKDVAQDGRYELIEMDAGGYSVSDCMQKWCMESAENRKQINSRLMEGKETLQGCFDFLKRYYNPAEMWWAEDNPSKRFTTYENIIKTIKSSPVFCTSGNWEAFCSRIPELFIYEGETGEGAVQEMMVDEYFRNRSKGDKWLEFAGYSKFRNGLYKLGLSDEKFEEVQEAVVITKETLKRVDELQKKYAADTEAQKERFDSALQAQKAQFDSDLKTEKEGFANELQAQQTNFASELQKQQDSFVNDIQNQQTVFDAKLKEQQTKFAADTKAQQKQLDGAVNKIETALQDMNTQIAALKGIDQRLINIQNEIQSGREDTNARLNSMEAAMKKNQASQNAARRDMEDIHSNVQEIKRRQDDQQTEINNLNKKSNTNLSEGGGGNQTAMIAAIAAVCLALILLVVFVVMAVKYVPVIKEAEIELKATPAPTAEPIYITAEPTEAPTPEPSLEPTEEPSPEPTETPAFTPVPDELQNYLAVCEEYELLLVQDKSGDGKWVYENDWASVEICLNAVADAADAKTAPTGTPDAKTAPTGTPDAKTPSAGTPDTKTPPTGTPNATADAEGEALEDKNAVTIVSSAYTLTVRKLEPALEDGAEAGAKDTEIEVNFQSLVKKLQEVCQEAIATPAPTAEASIVPASEEKPAASSEPNPT